MRRDRAVAAVAVAARAQQDDRGQRQPAAHRVHDDRAGEIVELRARQLEDPGLDAEALVPGDAFEERVDHADQDGGGRELRAEAGPLGDPARDDGRDGGGEGEQEEELHQVVAVAGHQLLGAHQEAGAVGHGVAEEEIGDRGDAEVRQDLHQGVDLVLLADGSQFQEGEARMHRQHHHGAEQDEEDVRALFECFHRVSLGSSCLLVVRSGRLGAPRTKSKQKVRLGRAPPGCP